VARATFFPEHSLGNSPNYEEEPDPATGNPAKVAHGVSHWLQLVKAVRKVMKCVCCIVYLASGEARENYVRVSASARSRGPRGLRS
jgi:hypothetical protein